MLLTALIATSNNSNRLVHPCLPGYWHRHFLSPLPILSRVPLRKNYTSIAFLTICFACNDGRLAICTGHIPSCIAEDGRCIPRTALHRGRMSSVHGHSCGARPDGQPPGELVLHVGQHQVLGAGPQFAPHEPRVARRPTERRDSASSRHHRGNRNCGGTCICIGLSACFHPNFAFDAGLT